MQANILEAVSGINEKLLRKVRVGRRFLILYLILSFIPMLCFSVITFYKSQASVDKEVNKYCLQINKGIKANIDLMFKEIDDFTVGVAYNNEFQNELSQLTSSYEISEPDSYLISSDILNYLKRNIILNKKTIIKTSVITHEKKNLTFDIDYTDDKKVSSIISGELYNDAIAAKGKLLWSSYKKDTSNTESIYRNVDGGMQVTRSFNLKKDGSLAGVFSILYSPDYLQPTFSQLASEGDIYVIDKNNKVIFSNKKETMFNNFKYPNAIKQAASIVDKDGIYVNKLGTENLLFSCSFSKINGWAIVYITPYLLLEKDNTDFSKYILFASFIILAFSSFVAILFTTSISKPLKRLVMVTKAVKKGDFEKRDKVIGNDEMTELTICFNDMLEKIQTLIKEVYESGLRERDFKLKALQAQINPHFLYNTLDAMRWSARSKKDYDVSKRIEVLSNLFRLILSDDGIFTTFEQEIKYTEYYLYFQLLSNKDKLQVIWDVDDKIKPYKTIKLLLQPLVENCIIHGMNPDKEQLVIRIVIKDMETKINIEIADNGNGADISHIQNMLERPPEAKGHIALKNINDRIKEFYGDEYGLEFSSEPGNGTTVRLIVPKKLEGVIY